MLAEAMTNVSSRFAYGAAWVTKSAGEAHADKCDHGATGHVRL
jgi:hypothetical protein